MSYTIKPGNGYGWFVYQDDVCRIFCFTFWGAKRFIRIHKKKFAKAAAFNARHN